MAFALHVTCVWFLSFFAQASGSSPIIFTMVVEKRPFMERHDTYWQASWLSERHVLDACFYTEAYFRRYRSDIYPDSAVSSWGSHYNTEEEHSSSTRNKMISTSLYKAAIDRSRGIRILLVSRINAWRYLYNGRFNTHSGTQWSSVTRYRTIYLRTGRQKRLTFDGGISTFVTSNTNSHRSKWHLKFTIVCSPGFSGEYCLCTLKLPYFFCSSSGEKYCLSGWQGPRCRDDVNECIWLSTPCEHGRCVNNVGSYSCDCYASGYRGKRCQYEVNECYDDVSPCQNGATCTNTVGSYTCTCLKGFTGKNCTVDVNECTKDPNLCKNGGFCRNTYGNYTCHCTEGFEGLHCEFDIDECTKMEASELCYNGGICQNKFGSYGCICPSNFTGHTCEADVNECDALPCPSYQICRNTRGSYQCMCAFGFEGPRCTKDIDECSIPDFCKNNATCKNLAGGFICTCPSNFTGSKCAVDIDECARPNICLNSGTCINFYGGYTCNCRYPYVGDRCQYRNIDNCLTGTCHNGGVCHFMRWGVVCKCMEGYIGDFCERDVNECLQSPYPCSHGECINSKGSFTCRCYKQYNGRLCENRVDPCLNVICRNGGECVTVKGKDYSTARCKCPKKFRGKFCEYRKPDECIRHFRVLCKHNSTCIPTERSYVCLCKSGFFGLHCAQSNKEKSWSYFFKALFVLGIIGLLVTIYTLGNFCVDRLTMVADLGN